MTKIIIIVLILAAIVVVDIVWFSRKFVAIDKRWEGYKIISYELNNKQYRLLVADTDAKRAKGLMHVRRLDNLDGMIFLFKEKQIQTFWNQNTLMDLDVYWLDGKKVVGYEKLPSIEKTKDIKTITSPRKADTVIEFPVK